MQANHSTPKICPACNSHYGIEVAFCSRDGTPLVADTGAMKTDLVGQVLVDRYRILRLLGEGGMGQVYEAQHVNINKKFAIKLLRPEITSNEEAVARFRQEAWSASSIGHENIIEIDDFSTLPNGAVYLAMEFLKGRSLAERMLAPPPMALDETLDVMLQVCRGLEAAHGKNIVHRDMKPENVFLSEKPGRVIAKILDFGIAKVSGAEASSQSLTRTGTIFGTPHYMSPEQALGRSLDHRADIYSVGVMMYEAFTGRVPFEAESFMGILTKHITVEPTPPRQIAPDREILPEVEAVILRAMAKEVADRYQSMHELVVALEAVAAAHAPHVLQHQSGSISAAMAIGSGAYQVASQVSRPGTPPGLSSARATPMPRSQSPSQSGPAADEGLVPAPANRTGLYAAVVLALLGIGGAAYVLTRPKPQPALVTPAKDKMPPPPIVAPPPVAADVTILVDSNPLGAEIVRDGARLGDTPQNITLKGGEDETIVLRKAGYVSAPVLLRHDGPARRIVPLLKEAKLGKDPKLVSKDPKETTDPKAGKVESHVAAPPPVVAPPLIPGPSVRPTNVPKPRPRTTKPQQGSDIIDPYKN